MNKDQRQALKNILSRLKSLRVTHTHNDPIPQEHCDVGGPSYADMLHGDEALAEIENEIVPAIEAVLNDTVNEFEQDSILKECRKKAKKQRKKVREHKEQGLMRAMAYELCGGDFDDADYD
jgi:hypothetical protein